MMKNSNNLNTNNNIINTNNINILENTESKSSSNQDIISHFSTPEEEINYLRRQIEEKEMAMRNMPRNVSTLEHTNSTLKEHGEKSLEQVYENNHKALNKDIIGVINSLKIKNTNKQVMELASIMQDDGVRFAMEIAKKLSKPEIEDDFHKFLINYLISGQENVFKSIDNK